MPAPKKIALIMDWDLTLIPHYMQHSLFKHFKGINDEEAAGLVNEWINKIGEFTALGYSGDAAHAKAFLHFIPEITNADLRMAGQAFEYNPGALELLPNLRRRLAQEDKYRGVEIIGSIVSSGYQEPIMGSKFAQTLLERPITEADLDWLVLGTTFAWNENGVLVDAGRPISMTEKTQQLFRINKGPYVSLNDSVEDKDREVPFEFVIGIGDGPTDVPFLSVIKSSGGYTHMVFNPDREDSIEQVMRVGVSGKRANTVGPWNYTPGLRPNDTSYHSIEKAVLKAANRVVQNLASEISETTVPSAGHLRA
jgi:hypothetical protein